MTLILGIGFTAVSGFKGDQGNQGSNSTNNDKINYTSLQHAEDEVDAAYVGMVFLNALFAGGRGIVIFAIFGLEYDIVIQPLVKWCRTVHSLYIEPPTEKKDDPRLYNWTLYLPGQLFQIFPNNRSLIRTISSNPNDVTIT